MFGRNSTEGWTQVAHRIQNTTYKVTGLTIGVSYYFVVRAENSHGMSGPSQLSEPITIGMVSYKIHVFYALCFIVLITIVWFLTLFKEEGTTKHELYV